MRGVVVGGINEVIEAINGLIDQINESLGLDIPKLPTLATGALNFVGGQAIVGEQGPEIVTLPAGANIFPTNTMPNQGPITTNNVSTQNIFNLNLAGSFASGNIAADAETGLRELQVAAAINR